MAIDGSTLSRALDAVHPVPVAGQGATVERFAVLAQLGAADLALARLAEGHLDALAICDEARYRPRNGLLGVWAADPPSARLQARVGHDGWTLHGLKRWCSGASLLDRALVTAHADDGYRLFDVDLGTARVVRCGDSWNAMGMADSETLDVEFDAVPVARDQAVGGSDWYLYRRGFWVGGIGVAACWYGGALGAMHTLRDTLAAAGSGDPHAMAHLGAADALCAALRARLRDAAAAVDDGVHGEPLRRLAWQVRAAVERLACDVLEHATRGLGAGGLTRDRAMADASQISRSTSASITPSGISLRWAFLPSRRPPCRLDTWMGDIAGIERVPDSHFEDRYQREGDPWQLEHPWYERRKRRVTLACLARDRYRRAFEPACGPGC